MARDAGAAVEFAILSPLFIMLLMGMAAYGIYFGASHSVQQIAADAARSAVAGLTQAERRDIVRSYVDNNASGYPFIDVARLNVDARDSAQDANQFVVSVAFDARELPIWYLFGPVVMPDMTIRRQSTIRVGGL
jgi:Flp pilus assembly protein TadG